MSLHKTKVMSLSVDAAKGTQNATLLISRGEISYVEQFRYLGSISSQDVSMQAEVPHRLSQARHAFVKLNRVWKDQHLSKGVHTCQVLNIQEHSFSDPALWV